MRKKIKPGQVECENGFRNSDSKSPLGTSRATGSWSRASSSRGKSSNRGRAQDDQSPKSSPQLATKLVLNIPIEQRQQRPRTIVPRRRRSTNRPIAARQMSPSCYNRRRCAPCVKLFNTTRFKPDAATRNCQSKLRSTLQTILLFVPFLLLAVPSRIQNVGAQTLFDYSGSSGSSSSTNAESAPTQAESNQQPASTANLAACFGGLQTFEKISMSSFENPVANGASGSFGGILVQQDDQALTSECINLCRSQANCLSFVIDYNKFECKSYATTQQELQQEYESKFQGARSADNTGGGGASANSTSLSSNETNGYQQEAASSVHAQQLLPSASSNYFEKICLDGVANRNQFSDVCGPGRLWTVERVVDTFLDGFVEKEVTNVNNKDECSKLCLFETQFVCRSADYDQSSRLCRLSKEDRRTQPQAMRHATNSNRQYLENQCATPGPSSCVYETKRNLGIISMDALKFAQTAQDCQMKCNQETSFNCRSYSFHQQRCFLSGDDSVSLNSELVKLPVKTGWQFGEKKCLVELCSKGIFSYEKITGYTLRSALATPIDLMTASGSSLSMAVDEPLVAVAAAVAQSRPANETQRSPLAGSSYQDSARANSSSIVSQMMLVAANSNQLDPLQESASSSARRSSRTTSNLAITEHCRHSCDLGYLNCPAFTIDYKNNRCQRLDRNSQGRHHELVAHEGHSYYEKICLRVPEMMSMCQDKYWIFERVVGAELAPRFYDKALKFVQSRRDCEEYCLEERQFQCRSALYNDETSDCKLSQYDRRLAQPEGGYYKNFNARVSYLENQCVRDHNLDRKQCFYEQARDEPAYPTYTERIEMAAQLGPLSSSSLSPPPLQPNKPAGDEQPSGGKSHATQLQKLGVAYCEQLCNDNARFECHSFGFYASTAQCFLSGDDSISAGELASTPSTGFVYHEKRCRFAMGGGAQGSEEPPAPNRTSIDEQMRSNMSTSTPMNPYLQPPQLAADPMRPPSSTNAPPPDPYGPFISNNNISIHIDQQMNMGRPARPKPSNESVPGGGVGGGTQPDQYKCGLGHSFVYQRISGFEPIGGYLTLLVKNNEQPGIVAECAELCKRAFECRAFIVDYASNQCFAMLENSSVGLLSLRQTLGKDYFEGFCVADHLLLTGASCRNKTWIVDKIVDQAIVGVQHQRLLAGSDRAQCRQACLEERLFWCKSAMFDSTTAECKLYSIDRETIPQMRLLFTKGVDFFENQCQIVTSSCPYDAIERDMTIITSTKSVQARSTFDCELACNSEISFNCRAYTYLDQYPGLPNLCVLSSDSRSTSQRGSVKEQSRSLYAERNCYYRRPRYPGGAAGGSPRVDPYAIQPLTSTGGGGGGSPTSRNPMDPYGVASTGVDLLPSHEGAGHAPLSAEEEGSLNPNDLAPTLGQPGCEPHQFTFERTFGYDLRLAPKERAPIAPTIGIAISCQQECLKRANRCQSFVVDYALPYQSCFLIETQAGANKRLLVKSASSAYFEKVCLPRTGLASEFAEAGAVASPSATLSLAAPLSRAPLMMAGGAHLDDPTTAAESMDISPSYSHEPWSPRPPTQLPYYFQQQHLVQNYPSRSCAKLWSFERFVNHNFTAPPDRLVENSLSRAHCQTLCLNEATFSCRAATYDYANRVCRLFKNTRRTILSQLVDLETQTILAPQAAPPSPSGAHPHAGTAHIVPNLDPETVHASASGQSGTLLEPGAGSASTRRQAAARQAAQPLATAEPSEPSRNVDYMENTCAPEPSSCQYRQLYDQFSAYIDKVTHAVSSSDCQRQCDQERLFSCKAINFDANSRNCMLLNEDSISLNRGQQAALLAKKNTVYSEKGNCEMISVQCNSQEMLVFINFDSPFRGRIMAKGNPDKCFLVGDGQTSLQFPIVFGPKCNSRQEGHNTFVNEVVIQQHPVIMTESDKTVRVMCAFEAPEQTITLKNPSSRDNRTGIDVGAPEVGRTRQDKQHFNSVVSNKAAPPSVVLRILDQNGRDASMINLGDDLVLKIQMQMMDGQSSALGIFARNLIAKSSNGESLLLIDHEGCPVDHHVFPALEIDQRDGKSLYSTFKAFRFPSSGLVNFEVQIRFCPERCQPIDCQRGPMKMRSFGRRRRRRDLYPDDGRATILQSVSGTAQANTAQRPIFTPLETKSTVMTGKAFEYVKRLILVDPNAQPATESSGVETSAAEQDATDNQSTVGEDRPQSVAKPTAGSQADVSVATLSPGVVQSEDFDSTADATSSPTKSNPQAAPTDQPASSVQLEGNLMIDTSGAGVPPFESSEAREQRYSSPAANAYQKSMIGLQPIPDERVLPKLSAPTVRVPSPSLPMAGHSLPPYGRFPSPLADNINNMQSLDRFRQAEDHHPGPQVPPDEPANLASPSANEPAVPPLTESIEGTYQNAASKAEASETRPGTESSPPEEQLGRTTQSNHLAGEQAQTLANQVGAQAKDLPLRFSILVGESQPPASGWAPVNKASLFVMNSSNVELDHIVIPGKKGQFAEGIQEPAQHHHQRHVGPESTPQTYASESSNADGHSSSSRTNSNEQPYDGYNSIGQQDGHTQDVSKDQSDLSGASTTQRNVQKGPETAASRQHNDCHQTASASSRLSTVIWTGALVLLLNICLVVASLVLYFKRVQSRKNHTIVHRTSSAESEVQLASGGRWPSVLLKSKNKLGTSLNAHEHFFCKLNSNNGRSSNAMERDFNWPNLSSSSSRSTVSSLASPVPTSSLRGLSQARPSLKTSPFDCNSSLKSSNFQLGHKTILELSNHDSADKFNARYTNNIDDLNHDRF